MAVLEDPAGGPISTLWVYRPVFGKDSGRPIGLAATSRVFISISNSEFGFDLSCHLDGLAVRVQILLFPKKVSPILSLKYTTEPLKALSISLF
jgi:hypothetical protein